MPFRAVFRGRAALGLLAGCAAFPLPGPDGQPAPVPVPESSGAPQAPAGTTPLPFTPEPLEPAEPGALDQALASLRARVAAPVPYQASLTTKEWAGTDFKQSRFAVFYRPPDRVKTVVQDSNQWMAGMTVVAGGGKVPRVRLPSFLSFLEFDVPTTDDRARSGNGLYPGDVTPAAFARWALAEGATVAAAGQSKRDERTVIVARIAGVEFPAGMRNAEIGICVIDGAIILGRLWESASRAYEFEVHDLLDREVSDQELGF